jgi:serine/threonine protein kinase
MVEGDLITPNLKLIRPLGGVKPSRVWLAHDSTLDRDVAVKVLEKALARHSPQWHLFQREADLALHIKSAHVAPVLGHGVSTAGLPYLTMEFLDGEDLASRLRRDGPLALHDVARLVSQLARGLGKAHLLGLVHRNLKPTNVFLASSSEAPFEVKVLDVGLSCRWDLGKGGRMLTASTVDQPAPEFASPEQVFGVKDVDFRADLWAIAIVAYNALTGGTPFRGANANAFALAIDNGAFEPPSTFVPSLPPAVDAWFVKALQRDPAARFGGAREFAEDFVRASGADPHDRISRTSVTPPMAMQRPAQRNGDEKSSPRYSMTSLTDGMSPNDAITVLGPKPTGRLTSALLIALIAIVGIGTVIAGFALLHG